MYIFHRKTASISLLLLCALGGPARADGSGSSARSNQLSQERLEKERAQAEVKAHTLPVAEALSAVEQTQAALKALNEHDNAKAKTALDDALAKTDLLVKNQPGLALVPLAAEVRIMDLAVDDQAAKRIAGRAGDLMQRGQIQAARKILATFASEIDLSTMNIPMATYPGAIRAAQRLMSEDKSQAAQGVLMAAMNTLVVVDQSIPIPVVKAQALVDEVHRQESKGKVDRKEADLLLDDASSQLTLAQTLGYGDKKDFDGIESSIKLARADIDKNGKDKSLLARIKTELAELRAKTFGSST
jgi:hypothetical protein